MADNKRPINPVDINNSTFINFNKDEPIDLDFNKFLAGNSPDETIHEISTTNDLQIISEV
jgi:hypothetical protein